MKRVWAGLGLLTMAGMSSMVLATPGGAQSSEPKIRELEARWSPNPADPGEAVTLTPVDNCIPDVDRDNGNESEPGVVLLFADLDGDGEFNSPGEVDETPMNDDFSWSYDWTAPRAEGEVIWYGVCQTSTWAEEAEWCGFEDAEAKLNADGFQPVSYSKPVAPMWDWFDCQIEVYTAPLNVGRDTPPTTAPPGEVPPPATPIVKPPTATG